MELLKVTTLNEAQDKILSALEKLPLRIKKVESLKALGFVLAKEVKAQEDVPPYSRSTVDGYALKASDTFAAQNGEVILKEVGRLLIDEVSDKTIEDGETIYVQTGSFLPHGADSVEMIEYTRSFLDDVAIYKAIAPLENVIEAGDDIKCGEVILEKGTRLDVENIGILVALGIKEVEVYEPFKIAVISSGDELSPPFKEIKKGKIRDINTYTLSLEAEKAGLEVIYTSLKKDDKKELIKTLEKLKYEADIIVLSGGSSKGEKDYTSTVFKELASEVLFHGVAIKPGKPTLSAFDLETKTLLVGLPGNPLAAFLMFKLLLEDGLGKLFKQAEKRIALAKIKENVSSNSGRATCLLVDLVKAGEDLLALPLYTKSANIAILSKAKGYVVIPENKEGLKEKEIVEVVLK